MLLSFKLTGIILIFWLLPFNLYCSDRHGNCNLLGMWWQWILLASKLTSFLVSNCSLTDTDCLWSNPCQFLLSGELLTPRLWPLLWLRSFRNKTWTVTRILWTGLILLRSCYHWRSDVTRPTSKSTGGRRLGAGLWRYPAKIQYVEAMLGNSPLRWHFQHKPEEIMSSEAFQFLWLSISSWLVWHVASYQICWFEKYFRIWSHKSHIFTINF